MHSEGDAGAQSAWWDLSGRWSVNFKDNSAAQPHRALRMARGIKKGQVGGIRAWSEWERAWSEASSSVTPGGTTLSHQDMCPGTEMGNTGECGAAEQSTSVLVLLLIWARPAPAAEAAFPSPGWKGLRHTNNLCHQKPGWLSGCSQHFFGYTYRFVFKKANRTFERQPASGEKPAGPSKRQRGTESQGISQMNGDAKRVKKSGPEPTEEVMKENADYKRINSDLMRRCSTLETAMQVHSLSRFNLPALSYHVSRHQLCQGAIRWMQHRCSTDSAKDHHLLP